MLFESRLEGLLGVQEPVDESIDIGFDGDELLGVVSQVLLRGEKPGSQTRRDALFSLITVDVKSVW